jgi:hypothetical protein
MDGGYRWRIRRFLGSAGHIVGMVFAIGGIIMLNSGLTGGLLGVALIAVLYVTGYFIAERPRTTGLRPQQSKDAPTVRAQLDEMLSAIRKVVADDIYRRVQSIGDAIVFTLDHAGDMDHTDPNIYLVRKTATTYLPEALSTYLALPREYAEHQVLEGGRTSHDILLEQLYLMDRKVQKVAEAVLQRDSNSLLIHGRFVADRYKASGLDVADEMPAAARRTEREKVSEPSAHVH